MSLRHIASAVSAMLLAACQGGMPSLPLPSSLSAYRINIQQGNFVTQDMVAKLQPGMTRSQVRFVLGTPLVTDAFHPDRWDYVYRFEKAGKLIEHRRIVAVFSEDKLLRIEGDVVPAKPAAEPVASKPAPGQPAAAPAPGAAVVSSPATKPATEPVKPQSTAPNPAPAQPAPPATETAAAPSPAAKPAETASPPAPEENASAPRPAGPRGRP